MGERQPAHTVAVTEDHDGQRLDNFVARILSDLPRSAIYRVIRRGEVRVNGGRKSARHKLLAGDLVRIPPVIAQSASATPVASESLLHGLDKRILFENDQLLFIDKPSGLAVHGGSGVHLGLIESLRQLRRNQFLELCHRLDRDTSGVIAIAKSRSGLLAVQAALRERQVKKRYQLIAHGRWPDAQRTVQAPLLRYLTTTGERRVKVNPEGKPSRTDFMRLDIGAGASRLQATLHSGRTHQIRVHAAHCGHPVVGDEKYGTVAQRASWARAGISQLALHAERFRVVVNDVRIDVRAQLPERFERIWQACQRPPSTG